MKFLIILSIALAATTCAISHIPPSGAALTHNPSRNSVQPHGSPINQASSSFTIFSYLSQILHPKPALEPAPRTFFLSSRSTQNAQTRDNDNGNNNYGDDNYTSAYLYAQAHHLPGGYRTTPSTPLARHNFALAHGTLMALTFTLFFPLGAAVMHVSHRAHWHAAIQVFAYANTIAGLGLGIWLGRNVRYLDYAHTVIGMAVVAALVLQLGLGVVAHGVRRGGKVEGGVDGDINNGEEGVVVGKGLKGGWASWKRGLGLRFVHRWVGRGLIALGIINGGLGLKLAQNTTGGKIAYGVVAGVVGTAYLVLLAVTIWRRHQVKKEEMTGMQSSMLT